MFKIFKKLILIDLVCSVLTLPLLFFVDFSAFAQSPTATYVPATQNSEARIEFRIGEAVTKDEASAFVDQLIASAPVQSGAPVKVAGLAKRTVATGYFVQAASYTSLDKAEAALNGFDAGEIESAKVRGTQYFRVLVGPFKNTETAKEARTLVAAKGFSDAFVKG